MTKFLYTSESQAFSYIVSKTGSSNPSTAPACININMPIPHWDSPAQEIRVWNIPCSEQHSPPRLQLLLQHVYIDCNRMPVAHYFQDCCPPIASIISIYMGQPTSLIPRYSPVWERGETPTCPKLHCPQRFRFFFHIDEKSLHLTQPVWLLTSINCKDPSLIASNFAPHAFLMQVPNHCSWEVSFLQRIEVLMSSYSSFIIISMDIVTKILMMITNLSSNEDLLLYSTPPFNHILLLNSSDS